MSSSTPPKQFLPLKGRTPNGTIPPTPASVAGQHQPKVLRGVVFDVDGTLCIPQTYMFGQMRDALGITKKVDILDHIYELPTVEEQQAAMEKIRAVERAAMSSQEAQPGLAPLMDYLDSRGIPKAICTRNFETPVQHLLNKFLEGHVFAPIVTRDFRPPKPDPAGILHIARSWGLLRSAAVEDDTADPAEVVKEQKEEEEIEHTVVPEADGSGLIMVGDSIDDITAGRRAGAATVLLVNDVNRHLADHENTDVVISQLDELVDILENGFVGRQIGAPSA